MRETRGTLLRDVDRELDAVAVDDDRSVIAVGSCRWTAGPISYREKAKLDVLAAHLVPDVPPPRLYFFGRHGVDADLAREAQLNERVRVVSPEELFGA